MDTPDLSPQERLLDNISKCVLHFEGEGALAYIHKYHNAVVEAAVKALPVEDFIDYNKAAQAILALRGKEGG